LITIIDSYLTSNPAFQKNGGIVVDELEFSEDVNPLLIVWYKLQILIRHREPEVLDISPQNVLSVQNIILRRRMSTL